MIVGVKKCLDSGDVKGLRYIFLDSLDVDPTFEKYNSDYEICKAKTELFEPYLELTELTSNHSDWTMGYWENLKLDLKKNFAEKRFEHMIEVAKVVHSAKVTRLLEERAVKQTTVGKQIEEITPKVTQKLIQPVQQSILEKTDVSLQEYSMSEQDRNRINKSKRDIELHNQKVAQEELEKKRQREARARELTRQNALSKGNDSKKALGIVVGVILLIVVVVFFIKVL